MTHSSMAGSGGLNDRVAQVRALADAKGFSSAPERIWEMLALIHTEISEATDAYKKGEPLEHVGEELIDAVIRIFHLLSALGLDADALFDEKMARNWQRPHKFNTVRAAKRARQAACRNDDPSRRRQAEEP